MNISKREKEPEFVSFWDGDMDGITYGCLASFPYWGARLRLYSYDDTLKVPPGIELADARDICADETLVRRYIANGKIEPSKFSNLFRYSLLQKTGLCWVDSDFLCLKQPDFQSDSFIFGRQFPNDHPWSINGAILKVPQDSTVLVQLFEHAAAVVDLDQKWGIIGPELITQIFKEAGLSELARPISDFYPLPPDKFWMPLIPEETKAVETAVSGSSLFHLWHNQFKRSGYDKNLTPPPGSFLNDAFSRVGGLDGFTRAYDVDELKNQLGKWLPAEKSWPNNYTRLKISEMNRDITRLQDVNKFLVNILSTEPNAEGAYWVATKPWEWVDGSTVTFGLDGVIRKDGHRKGTWRCFPHAPNSVIVIWDKSVWMDLCMYDASGILKCQNIAGRTFNVVEAQVSSNETIE